MSSTADTPGPPAREPGLLTLAEKLAGAAAILGATLYVLVNGLYIRFYGALALP